MRNWILLALIFLSGVMSVPADAQNREVPYWASIRTHEMYMRVGPSVDYKIEWVYRREGLPVKIIRIVDGWRLIQDMDGTQGWVSQSLLSTRRTAIVIGKGKVAMRSAPDASGKLRWHLQPGVIGTLGECESGFCELDVNGHKGWAEQTKIWGTGDP